MSNENNVPDVINVNGNFYLGYASVDAKGNAKITKAIRIADGDVVSTGYMDAHVMALEKGDYVNDAVTGSGVSVSVVNLNEVQAEEYKRCQVDMKRAVKEAVPHLNVAQYRRIRKIMG